MISAENVMKKLCENYSALYFQTLSFDIRRPQDEPDVLFSYENLVKLYIKTEGTGIQVYVTMDDEDEYLEMLKAINTANGFQAADNQILSNLLTLVPNDIDYDEYYYASGYISTATTQKETLTIIFSFLFEDFQIYCSVGDAPDESDFDEDGNLDEIAESVSYDYQHNYA